MKAHIHTPTDLTVRQAAKILQISIHSLYELVNSGKLESYKVSTRGMRISTQQLDHFRNNGGVQ